MRTIFVFGVGAASGIIATVLLFTFNDAFDGGSVPAPGVGNASLVLDGTALRTLVNRGLSTDDQLGATEVSVHRDGRLVVQFAVTAGTEGPQGSVTVDPEVRNGTLEVVVVDARLVGIEPEAVAAVIQAGLREQLDALAGGASYRLLTIATVAGRLTLEIDL